jgi:glyoxylase-like metal-dependent hydrolase (beta-lactamase superfamily II)
MTLSAHGAKCIAPTGAKRTRFGETPAYEEGLYDLGNGVYAWLVPNGSWGEANAGLVTGNGQSVLIETLWDVPKTRVMLEAMEPLCAGAPMASVINTHGDGDHFFGNELVSDLEIITSAAAADQMAHHKPATMVLLSRLGAALGALPFRSTRQTGHWFQAMCAPYDFAGVNPTPANRTFEGELDIERGGRNLRLIEVGPAHTEGDLMVHVPDSGVLFTGDILFIGCTPVMWAGPLANWLNALDLIERLEPDIIVPGHGPLTDKSGVAMVRDYWTFLAAAAREQFDLGLGPDGGARKIAGSDDFRARGFLKWDSPERVVMNCHMLYREFQGKTGALSTAQVLKIMRSQALLAHALPRSRPAAMRQDAVAP